MNENDDDIDDDDNKIDEALLSLNILASYGFFSVQDINSLDQIKRYYDSMKCHYTVHGNGTNILTKLNEKKSIEDSKTLTKSLSLNNKRDDDNNNRHSLFKF